MPNPTESAVPDPLDRVARAALSAYGIGVTGLAVIQQGAGATLEVRAGTERLALRIHRPGYRTIAQTTSELIFVRHLHEHLHGTGVTVPQPVLTTDGSMIIEVDTEAGARHCDVLTWVDGDVLQPGDGLDDPALAALGRGLGLLHNASAAFEPPPETDLPRWDAAGMFTPAASPFRPTVGLDTLLDRDDRRLFDQIAERTHAVFGELDRQSDAFGVIHVDYILGNCHLVRRPQGWDLGVIDFADCGWGYYLYDLCPPLGNLAGVPGTIPDNPDFPRLRTVLLDGYSRVRELPPDAETHLPVLMAARNANHVLWAAGRDMSPTPARDAAWRMELARRCLALAK